MGMTTARDFAGTLLQRPACRRAWKPTWGGGRRACVGLLVAGAFLATLAQAGEAAPINLVLPRTGEARSAIPLASLASLDWGTVAVFSQAGTPARALDQGVVTYAGDIIRGIPTAIGNGQCTFVSDAVHGDTGANDSTSVESSTLPVTSILAIVLSPLPITSFTSATPREAGVLLANGDFLAGQIAFLDRTNLGINTGRRMAQIPRERVAAIFNGPGTATKNARSWRVTSFAGDVWFATETPKVQGTVLQWGNAKNKVSIDTQLIATVEAADATALTWDNAERIAVRDALGNAIAPDRDGFPGTYAGLAAQRGLILPATSDVTWACAGFTRFSAWFAVADYAQPARIRIAVDSAVVFDQTLQTGAPALPVLVAVANTKKMRLVIESVAPHGPDQVVVTCCHPLLLP